MNKLKLTSISGNSSWADSSGDSIASSKLHRMGFRSKRDCPANTAKEEPDYYLYMGAYPEAGTEFFVYYDGPLGEVKGSGNFRLVRVKSGQEVELDRGVMSLGHYNQGTSPTYYGKGNGLESYSFHISFTKEEARRNAAAAVK